MKWTSRRASFLLQDALYMPRIGNMGMLQALLQDAWSDRHDGRSVLMEAVMSIPSEWERARIITILQRVFTVIAPPPYALGIDRSIASEVMDRISRGSGSETSAALHVMDVMGS